MFCFKPFKTTFKKVKDASMSKNAKKWAKMFVLGQVVDSFGILLKNFLLPSGNI
jgi:hypothetical protein